ncbi:ABC transporter permease [Granulicella mallensis]|jgi:putative ABC transport system permease protein|uniref:Putative permease n=1 Tax=Granulicella mallensis TaxID=940614 RepID=A0A7W8E884_9BACT|nr:ABC transporter permease [Granulicella mallensis]MBB5062254.1 putative permease [Granulicella mallensis]
MNFTSRANKYLHQLRGFLLVIVSIAAALACGVVVWSIAMTYLFKPVPFPRPDTLVMGWLQLPGSDDRVTFSPGIFNDYAGRQRSFDKLAIFETRFFDTQGSDGAQRIPALRTSTNLFDLLESHPLAGRLFARSDEQAGAPPVVLLTSSYWRSRYGGLTSAIGKTIELDRQRYEIVGVLPDNFSFPLVGFPENNVPAKVVVPAAFSQEEATTRSAMFEYSLLGRLRAGVTIDQAQSEASTIVANLHQDYISTGGDQTNQQPNGITLSSLKETVTASERRPIQLLLAASALLLIIAGFNAATILLVRGLQQNKQYAIQVALGAGKRDFLHQAIAESSVISVTASVLGLVIGVVGLYSLNNYLSNLTPYWRVVPCAWWFVPLMFLVYMAVLSTTIYKISTVSMTVLGRRLFQEADMRVTGSKMVRLIQQICVSGQVALSVMLLLLSSILTKSLYNLRNADIGVAADHLYTATATLPRESYKSATAIREFYSSVLDGATGLPQTTQAGIGTDLPLDATETETVHAVDGHRASAREHIPVVRTWTTGDYLGTLHVRLIAGRLFSTAEQPQSLPAVVISESLATHLWGSTDVLGKTITVGPSVVLTVVGVVGDVKDSTVRLSATPHVYTPLIQEKAEMLEHPTWNGLRRMSVVLRSSADSSLLDSNLKGIIARLDRGLVVTDLVSVSSEIKRAALPESFMTIGTTALAAIAFALALVGEYSLTSFAAVQRKKEMGIRIALGARRGNILALSARFALLSALVGVSTGVILALACDHLVKSFVFGIQVNDPLTYVIIAICSLCAVAIAAAIPSVRSSRIDPMEALKSI